MSNDLDKAFETEPEAQRGPKRAAGYAYRTRAAGF